MPDARAAGRHVHIYFSSWSHESRAWRAGRAALDFGYASAVEYIGYRSLGSADFERRAEGEEIRRVGARPAKPGSSRLLRALSTPWWTFMAARAASSRRGVGLIVAHSLAALPAGVLSKLLTGAPLIYDAHELETEREGWSRPVRFASKLVEGALIGFCDHIMVVSGSIERWYRDRHPRLSVSTVRNVPEVLGARGNSQLRTIIDARDGDLVVVYLGAFTGGRGLNIAVEAFKRLDASKRLVLVGYGALLEEIRTAADGAENIHILPPVSPDRVVEFVSGADVGLCQANGTSLSYHYGLPNKLFEYAAAGLPVIVSRGPDMRAYVDETGAGWSIEPSVEALAELVGGTSRSDARAKSAKAETYEVPTWATERERFFDAVNRASKRVTPSGADDISRSRAERPDRTAE